MTPDTDGRARRRPERAAATLAILLVLTAALIGACAPGQADPGTSGDPDPASATDGASSAVSQRLSIDDLRAWGMSISRKQSSLPQGFPTQAPVVDGRIVRAEMLPGKLVAVYEIEVPHDTAGVIEWYQRSYAIANWVEIEAREAGEGVTVLVFEKGQGARTDLTVRETSATATLVEATVNVGEPTTSTY